VFPDWLTARADATPDATALIDAASGETWTYAALDRETDRIAGHLTARGIGPGDRVALLLETRPAFVRLIFAVQRLGARLVPLNARLAPPELRAQIERVAPELLVCEARTAGDAADASGDSLVVSVDSETHPPLGDAGSGVVTPHGWALDEDVALLFTSGTTGRPKAVRITPGNVLASAVASAFRLGVDPDDRWYCPLSLYHTGGLSIPLRCTLYGATAVLGRTPGFDANRALAHLRERGCTAISLVPAMLRRLLDADGDGAGPLDSLRFVLLGGAPADDALLWECERRGVPACPTYGMTETASQIATAQSAEGREHPGTVGRPLLGTEVTVLGEDGDPLPRGEVGELAVAGPTVTPGYLDEAVTAEAFGPHGLRTGDVGYRDAAGRLWVLNRRSDRIVTGGENVDPGTVTDVLREHPGVVEAAVIGLPDEEFGERVGALVVPADGNPSLTPAALADFCEGRLAGFERPRTVALVEALPRTASGTVDRERAQDLARERGVEV
jgi:O-succinylbenzoic acid--CoA ligase